MKKAILISIILSICFEFGQAQEARNIHLISLYQSGSVRYQTEGIKRAKIPGTNINQMMTRWDWIMPKDGMWAYLDGSGWLQATANLASGTNKKLGYASIMELGYGFILNNKKPIMIGEKVSIKIGLGFSFGVKSYVFPTQKELIGSIPLELGSFISVGRILHIFPKVGAQPLYEKRPGFRTFVDMKCTFRITKNIGLNLTMGRDGMYFKHGLNPGKPVDETRPFQRFGFGYFQYGITFGN